MTDQTDPRHDGPDDIGEMDDIELITSYLNEQLDPERVEAVRRRLEEDAAFRDLAAPLLLMWSVPKHLERYPRPEGELERNWEAFKQRVGFPELPPPPPPPAPKPKRRWRRLLVLLLIMSALFIVATNQQPSVTDGPYTEILHQPGWVSLQNGIEVTVAPGAVVRVDQRPRDGRTRVLLEGSARFRVFPLDPATRTLRTDALLVETRAGSVSAGESDFSVSARGDTTTVGLRPFGPRRALQPHVRTVYAYTDLTRDERAGTYLLDHHGARLVRGQRPETYSRTVP
jgi:hypothetical protein